MQTVSKNMDVIISRMIEGGNAVDVANVNWANANGRNDKHRFGEDDLI